MHWWARYVMVGARWKCLSVMSNWLAAATLRPFAPAIGCVLICIALPGCLVSEEQTLKFRDAGAVPLISFSRVSPAGVYGVIALQDRTLVGVGSDGVITRSTDGKGEIWSAVKDSGTNSRLTSVIAVGDGKAPVLVAVGDNGAIVRSTDGKGESWSAVKDSGTKSGLRNVIAVGDGKAPVLVAVGMWGAIVRSIDGKGESWSAVKDSGTVKRLTSVVAVGDGKAPVLVAVGSNGAIVRSYVLTGARPRLLSAASGYGPVDGHPVVTMSFQHLGDDCQSGECLSGTVVNGIDYPTYFKTGDQTLQRPVAPAAWTQVGPGKFRIALDPKKFGAAAQVPLYLRVRLSVAGYSDVYPEADGNFLVPNHPAPMPLWILGLLMAAALSALLYALMLARPLALLRLANRPTLWQATESAGVPGVTGFIILVLSKLLMPILIRQRRVLDAWVLEHSQELRNAFDASTEATTDQKTSFVPLPFLTPDGQRQMPTAEAFTNLSRAKRSCIQIVGQGGAGKTRLAIQVCQWLFDGAIGSRPAIAVFVDQEFDDLLGLVTNKINAALGDDPVSLDFVCALLRGGQLWIVVDRLSERRPETQRAFGKLYERVSPRVLLCTARYLIRIDNLQPLVLKPLPLDQSTLLSFLGEQLQAEGAIALYPSLGDQGALVTRLARLITVDGRELAVTPLLVRVFVYEAVALMKGSGERSIEMLPESVPEVYFSYVERLDSTQPTSLHHSPTVGVRARRAAALVALVELGDDFRPKPVPRTAVETMLGSDVEIAKSEIDYLDRMLGSGLLASRKRGGQLLVDFVLDPVAECFAAYMHAVQCGSDAVKWRELLDRVEARKENAPGFMLALRMNHAAYREALGFPEVEFPPSQN